MTPARRRKYSLVLALLPLRMKSLDDYYGSYFPAVDYSYFLPLAGVVVDDHGGGHDRAADFYPAEVVGEGIGVFNETEPALLRSLYLRAALLFGPQMRLGQGSPIAR